MRGFETFQIYQSLRLHFTRDSYDATKYNFKTSVKEASFNSRRDKYFFDKWGAKFRNKEDLISFFVSNFTEGIMYIAQFNEKSHVARQSRLNAISYLFEKEMRIMSDLEDSFDSACKGFGRDTFMGCLMSNEISMESVILVDRLVGFIDRLVGCQDPLGVYNEWLMKVKKYRPFVEIPGGKEEKIKGIILREFT